MNSPDHQVGGLEGTNSLLRPKDRHNAVPLGLIDVWDANYRDLTVGAIQWRPFGGVASTVTGVALKAAVPQRTSMARLSVRSLILAPAC